jgi:hypothetical protein
MVELSPRTQKECFEFIREYHRHHNIPQGALWHHAIENDEGNLVGVAVVGRPVSRHLDDGYTCEVTRLCTNGIYNGCSILYAAAWRAAQAKGFRRILTYILESENGTSVKAAGWKYLGDTSCQSWDRPGRHRIDKHPLCSKHKYGIGVFASQDEGHLLLGNPARETHLSVRC